MGIGLEKGGGGVTLKQGILPNHIMQIGFKCKIAGNIWVSRLYL
jgi:hypothetical protein